MERGNAVVGEISGNRYGSTEVDAGRSMEGEAGPIPSPAVETIQHGMPHYREGRLWE